MLATVILAAGLCLAPPLFDLEGPPCVDPTIECGCSECFRWDIECTSPPCRTDWYEVVRRTESSGDSVNVGSVHPKLTNVDTGETYLPQLWCVAWDSSFPHEGVLYSYRVRGCIADGCSAWSEPPVTYRAAPYSCYEDGRRVQCYVGDPIP